MKKVIIQLILYAACLFSQISPNEFPKIGYADMYWLKKFPSYYNNDSTAFNYNSSSYYYPALKELGLTHVVTMGDNVPFSSYNPDIKILDNNFSEYDNISGYMPAKYATASGISPEKFAIYTAGGSKAYYLNEANNFGFGANNYYSRWLLWETLPVIGNQNYLDGATNRVSYMALSDSNLVTTTNKGRFVSLSLYSEYCSRNDRDYQFLIHSKIVNTGADSLDTVFTVRVREID